MFTPVESANNAISMVDEKRAEEGGQGGGGATSNGPETNDGRAAEPVSVGGGSLLNLSDFAPPPGCTGADAKKLQRGESLADNDADGDGKKKAFGAKVAPALSLARMGVGADKARAKKGGAPGAKGKKGLKGKGKQQQASGPLSFIFGFIGFLVYLQTHVYQPDSKFKAMWNIFILGEGGGGAQARSDDDPPSLKQKAPTTTQFSKKLLILINFDSY